MGQGGHFPTAMTALCKSACSVSTITAVCCELQNRKASSALCRRAKTDPCCLAPRGPPRERPGSGSRGCRVSQALADPTAGAGSAVVLGCVLAPGGLAWPPPWRASVQPSHVICRTGSQHWFPLSSSKTRSNSVVSLTSPLLTSLPTPSL